MRTPLPVLLLTLAVAILGVARLRALQSRTTAMSVAGWDRARQADWLAARAAMDEHEFLLTVQKPWARDPGFYVDPMLRVAFAELPLPKERVADFRRRLAEVPSQVEAAKRTLEPAIVPADFAKLALFNLRNSDGVGHGHPYREVPPAGVIGWYDDLLTRARKHQRELVPDVLRARELIWDFSIFRAARTIGDVRLQHNRTTTQAVAEYWRKWTPYLDPDVARVDAEIYLRRPPGYGLGYTIGAFQVQKLLGELRHRDGDAFRLRDFHDRFLAAGAIPIALIRYEMTGYDDEVARFWDRVPLQELLRGN